MSWSNGAVSAGFHIRFPAKLCSYNEFGIEMAPLERGHCNLRQAERSYLAGGSWVWVEPGALSGLPPGIWAAPSFFGAAEFGAAPVVDGDPGITTVPLTGGAGRTAEGLPSIGDADCAHARAVAARIAAPVNSPNDIFRISYSS